MVGASSNFNFLASHDPQLARLGALAERYFHDDAPTALIKLRLLAEFLAKEAAARHAVLPSPVASFDDTLRSLKVHGVLPREVGELFYHLKRLAKAFRGELVPQDPTEEPATALLARIRQSREAAPKPKRGRHRSLAPGKVQA
jgi:hypothetical protein